MLAYSGGTGRVVIGDVEASFAVTSVSRRRVSSASAGFIDPRALPEVCLRRPDERRVPTCTSSVPWCVRRWCLFNRSRLANEAPQ